jgi:peptide/nickel transport system permease protein
VARYLSVRVGLGLVSVLGVVLLTFVLQFTLPGDPARRVAGPRASPEVLALVREDLRLDDSLPVQLVGYVGGVLTGDLGTSYIQRRPVLDMIVERLPATLYLALAALVFEIVVGGALGVWDGLRKNRSRVLAAANVMLLSIPTFTMGFLLLFVFAYWLAVVPLGGGPGLAELVLPAIALGLFGVPYYATVVSESVREALASSYVRTAVAKGLPRRRIIAGHVLRTSLSPVITLAGLDFAAFLSGVVFIEVVFGWPGIGVLQQQAFDELDRPLLMGTVIVSAVLVVGFNLLADVLRTFVDPRTRAETLS